MQEEEEAAEVHTEAAEVPTELELRHISHQDIECTMDNSSLLQGMVLMAMRHKDQPLCLTPSFLSLAAFLSSLSSFSKSSIVQMRITTMTVIPVLKNM